MLVNPNVQPTSYTAQPAPVPNGVGQSDRLRSDLPPVEQTNNSSTAQNQQLKSEERLPNPSSTSKAPSEESSSESSGSRSTTSEGQEAQQARQQQRQDDSIIQQLKARDREVRLHEAAHAAVGGKYAGAPRYQYEKGPDGLNYAVSGEVSISVSEEATPKETLDKARQIRAAANAPAEPSAQDRAVAAQASRMETEARADIRTQEVTEQTQRSEQRKAERAAEQDRDDRVREQQSEQPENTVESVEFEAAEVDVDVSSSASPSNSSESSSESQVSDSDKKNDRNAKEELEEILLNSQSVSDRLVEAGFVDEQNPYGESGYVEYIV